MKIKVSKAQALCTQCVRSVHSVHLTNQAQFGQWGMCSLWSHDYNVHSWWMRVGSRYTWMKKIKHPPQYWMRGNSIINKSLLEGLKPNTVGRSIACKLLLCYTVILWERLWEKMFSTYSATLVLQVAGRPILFVCYGFTTIDCKRCFYVGFLMKTNTPYYLKKEMARTVWSRVWLVHHLVKVSTLSSIWQINLISNP